MTFSMLLGVFILHDTLQGQGGTEDRQDQFEGNCGKAFALSRGKRKILMDGEPFVRSMKSMEVGYSY
ncbi:hypothetical protein [Ammoniphilus sp. 3BR4]|uniref:hypothetical protein n=1 Tax=Ammoniphilus sp. 3BR4 TaxID=3158265 RepID=UPI0034667AB3